MIHTWTAAERLLCAMNTGKVDDLSEFISPDFQLVVSGSPAVRGIAGAHAYITMLRAAFPDLCHTIDDQVVDSAVAEGIVNDTIVNVQKIALHITLCGTHLGPLTNLTPKGNRITLAYLCIIHIHDDKITRAWVAFDTLECLQQLV